MQLALLKILGTIFLWIITLLFGYLPIRLPTFRTNKTLLSLSNCFAGGIFISIGLIHILPEAHESLEGRWEIKNGDIEGEAFPLSYLLCLTSFSFILLIDKIIFNSTDLIEEEDDHIDLSKSVLHRAGPVSINENFQELTSNKYKLALMLSKLNIKPELTFDDNDIEEYIRMIGNEDESLHGSLNDQLKEDNSKKHMHELEQINDEEHLDTNEHEHKHHKEHKKHKHKDDDLHKNKCHSVKSKLKKIKSDLNSNDHPHDGFKSYYSDTDSKSHIKSNVLEDKIQKQHHHKHDKHEEHGHHHKMIKKDDSVLSCYILLLAMGIHGFFEGVAFGVSGSFSEGLNMFIAMTAHKWSEALTIGISFVSADIPFKTALKYIIFFTFITPVGVILGTYLAGMDDTVVGIAKALSAGTFIYISCAEIIIEEFSFADKKFQKFLMYCLGIVLVVLMGLLE